MPEQPKNPSSDRLFIKVILPNQGKERKTEGGGSPPKPFRPVDDKFRQSLSTRVSTIQSTMLPAFKRLGSIPVRVQLIKDAYAKSHRPEHLFSEETCPIVGAGKLGEIFIKATSEGLNRINKIIESNKTGQLVKEISTIETIEPITPSYRLLNRNAESIISESPKQKDRYVLKVQLFQIEDRDLEKTALYADFLNQCKEMKVPVNKGGYLASTHFEVACKDVNEINRLSNIIGVRSVDNMPIIKSAPLSEEGVEDIPALPLPDAQADYPIVAVVDSGVKDGLKNLDAWIIGRDSRVAPNYRNTRHGTFVAGLLCWGKELNPSLKHLDVPPCMLFDFQVLPNDNPDLGATDDITESQFLQDLEDALKKQANKIKVWNISLGTDKLCSLDKFSSFAVELDRLQQLYQVSFVISAGNFKAPRLLGFPRSDKEMPLGRITAPADTVLGITVGAVSHVTNDNNWPKEGEPSPFSRHGAGPNHIIKPDLVHFGGTCNLDNSERAGLKSLLDGRVGESMGTSFSTPLVSRFLAHIYHSIAPTPSPVLARALLTHHARDPRNGNRVPDHDENFLGFGLPSNLGSALECTPWSATLVFDDFLRPGYFLEWDDFPYPDCLKKKGKFYGDVSMTVACAPSLNANWGNEYCETHIDAYCGVYYHKKSRKTGAVSTEFKGLVPPEHKNPGALYESFQIEKMRKWAPVRTYFGSLGDGERGERWRLKVRLLSRHGIDNPEKQALKTQPFSLIITVSDPEKKLPVYNDMAIKIRNRFKVENLTLKNPIQIRSQI